MPLCQSQNKIDTINDNSTGYVLESAPDYRLRIFNSLSETPLDWDIVQPAENHFLQRPYLSVVEKYPPIGYEFAYFIFYKNGSPVGICYCQLLEFKAGAIRDEANNNAFARATQYIKGYLIKTLKIKTIIIGNALLTGEHAFYFNEDITTEQQYALIADATKTARQHFEKSGEKFNGFLLKDFEDKNLESCGEFVKRGFHKVTFQPSMAMEIPEEWNSFDDYLAAFSSKYRTRAKRAFKKGKDIVKQDFNAERIRLNHRRIHELYQGIEAGAGFSFASLNKRYFCGLKERLGDDFSLTGYWLDEKLVGFYTTIKNGDELEAHFIGFEPQLNRSHQIYLNMLYDMVREGIDKGVKRIIFARTALEIKSSVGAVAEEMYCYTRHWNNLPNRFVPKIFSYLSPVEEWTPRKPFN